MRHSQTVHETGGRSIATGVSLRARIECAADEDDIDAHAAAFRSEEARLRNVGYQRWCDAADHDVGTSDALLRDLRAVGANATYVGFVSDRRSVWVYAAWHDGALVERVRIEPIDAPAIAEDDRVGPAPAAEELASVASLLLTPIATRLRAMGPTDRLFLSPDEARGVLPFGALPVGERRLCELVELSIVDSAEVLRVCTGRSLDAPVGSAFCVGAPICVGQAPLPYAEVEVGEIAAAFRAAGYNALAVVGADATIARLLELSPGNDVLHLACHADSEPISRLLLTADATSSGVLTDAGIAGQLRLKHGAFVNLSACSSGRRRRAAGPVARDLITAFLIAGARGVLGALWDLDDAPAAIFSSAFYAALLHGGTPASSLAEVQRACIAGELGEEMKPMDVWAAYVYFGA